MNSRSLKFLLLIMALFFPRMAIAEGTVPVGSAEFYIFLGAAGGLVLLAGLMSGLTLGLLSLEMMHLEILVNSGTEKEKKHANKIIPLVKQHHLLLVTLLLVNAGANEVLPIFLDKIAGPIVAVVISVTLVLIFGEILPQAVCSRYGLAVGAVFVPVVWFFIYLTFPVSWPFAKLLDKMLGHDGTTFFRRAQLKELVNMHDTAKGGPLSQDEVNIIRGALNISEMTVVNSMTPLEDVFMLDITERLGRDTMSEIIKRGHSRVPVCSVSSQNILGLLLVKNLIRLDPVHETPVASIRLRKLIRVTSTTSMYDLLNQFQTGKCHMALVLEAESTSSTPEEKRSLIKSGGREVKAKEGDIIGIITLEDVLEELLQEEIVDETDVFVENG